MVFAVSISNLGDAYCSIWLIIHEAVISIEHHLLSVITKSLLCEQTTLKRVSIIVWCGVDHCHILNVNGWVISATPVFVWEAGAEQYQSIRTLSQGSNLHTLFHTCAYRWVYIYMLETCYWPRMDSTWSSTNTASPIYPGLFCPLVVYICHCNLH